MIRGERRQLVDVDSFLDQILANVQGDDAQLRALHRGISDGLALPADVHVMGEPVSLVAVDYDGNARRGLVACCRREDGSEHRVAFADVQLRTEAAGYSWLLAYCKWLGIAPVTSRPAEAARPVRSLRNMTTQLLQEAAQVIPNQQLLINVVSRRVRQLGLGHRPLVEATPRSSLTDIALREIIAGKLTYELAPETPVDGAA